MLDLLSDVLKAIDFDSIVSRYEVVVRMRKYAAKLIQRGKSMDAYTSVFLKVLDDVHDGKIVQDGAMMNVVQYMKNEEGVDDWILHEVDWNEFDPARVAKEFDSIYTTLGLKRA